MGLEMMREISPQEKVIMHIVWDAGADYLTARDIEAAMLSLDGKERNLSSLMSVLAKLADKGFLDPVKTFRKSTVFIPLVSEAEYKAYSTKQFMDGVHSGEFASFVSALLNNDQYTEKDIEVLRGLLEKNVKERGSDNN